MSKLFSDPEYHKMQNDEESWLELAIEPFRFYINDIIQQLPNSIELTFDDVMNLVGHAEDDNWLSIEAGAICRPIIKKIVGDKELTRRELEVIVNTYDFALNDGTEIDFVNKTITNPISLNKKYQEIPEDEVRAMVATLTAHQMNIHDLSPSSPSHGELNSRMNEIIDLLGFEPGRLSEVKRTRSAGRKITAIKRKIAKIITEDEWLLRDYEVISSFCNHVENYINNGNMHSMMNVTRLKCMTHKGLPIYSMEELS